MTPFLAELTGTALLMIFGSGVVANVVLTGTKGNGSGWIVITFGWAMGVFVGVYSTAAFSGAHLNPAVTLALAMKSGDWSLLPQYLPAQFLGAMLGSGIVWLSYRQHFDQTTNPSLQLAVFCTAPAIRSPFHNFITEFTGTFVLITGVLFLTGPETKLGSLDALPVALLVLGVGLSLGGPTGYAINPARDLAPRLLHALLPIKGKGGSDWGYSWIPVLAPFAGAAAAAAMQQWLF